MKKILIFALCYIISMTLNAQNGWEKTINNGELYNEAVDFWEAPDGSFIVAYNLTEQGDVEDVTNIEIHLAHLDQDGAIISDKIIPNGDILGRKAYDLMPLSNGNFIIVGNNLELDGTTYISRLLVMEVTTDGDIIWEQEYEERRGEKVLAANNGDFYVFGTSRPQDNSTADPYMMRISAMGDSLWTSLPLEYPDNATFNEAHLLDDGTIYLFSRANSSFNGPPVDGQQGIVTKVDGSGTLISETIMMPEVEGSFLYQPDFVVLPTGGFALAAIHRFGDYLQPDYERFMVYKYDENIELEWATEIDSIPTNDFAVLSHIGHGDNQLSLDADGNFSGIFSTQRRFINNTPADYSRRYFVKIDQSGTILLNNTKDLTGQHLEYPKAFEQTSVGDYFFCGWHRIGTPNDFNTTAWSLGVKLDVDGNSLTNEINGNLYWDKNFDCDQQTDEQGFTGWVVEAQNDALTYYGVTDADGNYKINIGTGNYDLKAIPINDYWEICEGIVPITFTETYDTLSQNFSAQALLDCPGMWVDISTSRLRNCFDNTYTVNYCNHGTINEAEAYIEVTLPEGTNIVSADIPYIELADGILRFDIGAVAVNECGSFQFKIYVDCEVIELGETLCTEAHIYPDTLCMPSLMWSGASIQITGECDADNITYTIKNIGDAPTSQALEYIVVEDQVILMQGNFTLNPQEEEAVILPATGATYRLEAEQEPNHPGFSMPSLAIEGCGGLTPGQVNVFSINDNDPFIDIDCKEVVASYDPNDKTGYPLGYDEENFIDVNTQLEYLIRFQNTGTDTAFRVVLRDTLSQFLDPTTVRPGSSSHPYTFEMIGDGIMKFSFENILLPDIATNEPASQGFVKFKINQRANNEIGTVIHNSAAIYFDFNAPVITNETKHTIGEAFFSNIESVTPDTENIDVSVYPNPFGTVATIEIKEYVFETGEFELFDMIGRSVWKQTFDNPIFTFERSSLSAGTYAFTLSLDGKASIVGKLVIL